MRSQGQVSWGFGHWKWKDGRSGNIAPENGWLGDYCTFFLGGKTCFQGQAVCFRDGRCTTRCAENK